MKSELILKIRETEQASIEDVLTTPGRVYSYLNPVSYLTALDNKDLFLDMDGLFADGGILVKAIKLVYGYKITRRSFDMTSMAPQVFSHASENKKSVYIVASKQEELEKAVQNLKVQYPNLIIKEYRNGYFNSQEEIQCESKKIVEVNPDFLIVGMGALAQEKFLRQVKKDGFQGIGFTCGGFIHQTSKNEIDYYPEWIDKANLRFVYRMYKEKHTRKRYMQAAVLFPLFFIHERLFK